MRSILVAVYELGADEVCVVGHHDCGMAKIQASSTIEKMKRARYNRREIRYASLFWNRFRTILARFL